MRQLSRGAWVAAVGTFALLMLLGGRYGFHRDELYFIESGHHLDWAQPDNPITVPLPAAGWHAVVSGDLTLFRIVPAAVAAVTVLLAAATSRAVGGLHREQTLTAALMASTSILLAAGHMFSTTTFDVALTTAVSCAPTAG